MDFDDIKKLLSKIAPISWVVNLLLKRANLAQNTLKEKYSTVLRIGTLMASVLMLLGFYSLQRFENDIEIETNVPQNVVGPLPPVPGYAGGRRREPPPPQGVHSLSQRGII